MTGGLFVLEGLSNAGKSSLAKAIAESFSRMGCAFVPAFELSTPVGAALDQQFRSGSEMSPEYKALAFAADRRALIDEIIRPQRSRGNHVIIDRYSLTSMVYRYIDGLPESWLRSLDWEIPEPRLTIIVDISENTSILRASSCGKPTPYSNAYLAQARERYLALSNTVDTVVVDGEQEFEAVLADCVCAISRVLEV